MEMYVVVNIGCIECGVSSNIVAVVADRPAAERLAEECAEKFSWREGGQNAFEVFELPAEGVVGAEYAGIVA